MITRDEAAILSAFTGIAIGPFSDTHEYAERVLGRPIYTYEFASQATFDELREATRPDFERITKHLWPSRVQS